MRKKERLVGRAEEKRRGKAGKRGRVKAAYSGHQLGSRHDQTQHYRGDEEKQTHNVIATERHHHHSATSQTYTTILSFPH